MKREVATLPAHLPHAFKVRARGLEDGTCATCDGPPDAELHRELSIEKSAASPLLITEKGI